MTCFAGMSECPVTGLVLPTNLIDEKQALKKTIEDVVESSINDMGNFRENYFLTIHAKFDKHNPEVFRIAQPKATTKLPQFMSNTLVYWICPVRGIKELLWMVAAKLPGQKKLKVEFNQKGVAYLQLKQAMPGATKQR